MCIGDAASDIWQTVLAPESSWVCAPVYTEQRTAAAAAGATTSTPSRKAK
jgi:hypothetical protein